jgi:hypothetical protein
VEADIFSFGILCLWLLFETHFSGARPVSQGLGLLAIEAPGLAEYNLSRMKKSVRIYAQQLLTAETTPNDNQRTAPRDFSDASLSAGPYERDESIQEFLKALDSGW